MLWKPGDHSDQENLKWCWLRAVEWGRWPIFLSQTVAPLLLIWHGWQGVVGGVFIANILWALFVRYNVVSVPLAYIGVVIAQVRWIVWIGATITLFVRHSYPEVWVCLAWPVLIFPLGMITPVTIGRIQVRFMRALGYEPTQKTEIYKV